MNLGTIAEPSPAHDGDTCACRHTCACCCSHAEIGTGNRHEMAYSSTTERDSSKENLYSYATSPVGSSKSKRIVVRDRNWKTHIPACMPSAEADSGTDINGLYADLKVSTTRALAGAF